MVNQSITTVIAAAPSYDLTDLATIKAELAIKLSDRESDQFLKRGISQVSAAIKSYCNRAFQVETVSELIFIDHGGAPTRGSASSDLQLGRYPIIAVLSVIEDAGLQYPKTLDQGVDYLIKADTGQLVRMDSSNLGTLVPWRSKTVTVQYAAGYGADVTQAANVPANPGPYAITVTGSADFAVDLGVAYANGTAMVPVATSPTLGQYSVSPVTGIYTFSAFDQGVSVVISYATDDIPDDIVDAALRQITARFRQQGRDPMLMSKTQPNIGEERYWVGTQRGQTSAFPPEIQSLLDNYRVPVTA